MDLGLDGQVALVAASSRGLGRAIATGLAAEGARIVVSGRDESSLARTAREIREATGVEVDHVTADLTRAGSVRALLGETVGIPLGRYVTPE